MRSQAQLTRENIFTAFIKKKYLILDWPASHTRQHDGGGQQRPRGGRDRPKRVLHQRGVGHTQGPRRETRQGLRLLPRAIPGWGEESVQCSIWVNVRDLEILCNTIEYLTCMHSPNNAHSLTLFNSLFILFTTFKNHQPFQGHVYNAPILSLVKRRVTE